MLRSQTRLLSWNGPWLHRDVADEFRVDIIEGLTTCFKSSADNFLLAEQVLDGVACLPEQDVEGIFLELFATLLRNPGKPFEMVSHHIARYLSTGSDKEVTNRLVKLAQNAAPGTGYIRRYIVESLEKRGGFDRKKIFLSLIVDPDPNVRTWVKGWYRSVENEALRNKLIEMIDDEKNTEVAMDLITALGESQLQDTAELIHQRVINGNLRGAALEWACRSLAWLKFSNVVPYLMQTIQSSPSTDLSGHALIAIGDLRAKGAMSLLFNLLESEEIGLGKNKHWLIYAFHHIAEEKDYAALSEKCSKGKAANLSALILAGTGNRCWDHFVFQYVLYETIEGDLRFQVLQEWCQALTHPKYHQDNSIEFKSGDFVTVSSNIEEHLHTIFSRNEKLSALALLILINTSSDLKRVAEQVMLRFGDLFSDFNHRTLLLCRQSQWSQFGKLIRPWLHRQIEQTDLSPQYANNWFELLRMVADHSTVDLLHRDRQRYNSLFDKGLVDALENRIRKGSAVSPMGDM